MHCLRDKGYWQYTLGFLLILHPSTRACTFTMKHIVHHSCPGRCLVVSSVLKLCSDPQRSYTQLYTHLLTFKIICFQEPQKLFWHLRPELHKHCEQYTYIHTHMLQGNYAHLLSFPISFSVTSLLWAATVISGGLHNQTLARENKWKQSWLLSLLYCMRLI